jgi:hypothetical protein
MTIAKNLLAGLCLIGIANPLAAHACVGPREAAALKIATLQQRLMVAGLTCHAGEAYNRFVLTHRAELQRSDDDLKDYFIKNGGEAGYDSYKTKAANLAAHGPATDLGAFCAATERDFSALARSGDLQAAAADEALGVGEACAAPVLAMAGAPAVHAAGAVEVAAALPRDLPAMPYAEAQPPLPHAMIAAATPAPAAPAQLQPVAAGRDDRYAALPPPPSGERGSRYWYYRRLYARRGAYDASTADGR